jgi:transposase-like protein
MVGISMSNDDSGGFDLQSAIESGADAVRNVTSSFLGVEREAYVCPDCDVACQATTTYNPRTAAFDGGASPAWVCPECAKTFVREVSDESHTLDLYGRGPSQ